MKHIDLRLHYIPGLIILFGFSGFLCSCNSYNFSGPQPVDKKNIYEFPDEFIGKWVDKEESNIDFFLISKKNVLLVLHDTVRIVKGAWPQLTDTGAFLYPPDHRETLKTINYDSLKRPLDTVDNFLQNGKHIYKITSGKFLERGYPYSADLDTIIVVKNDTIYIDLGQNAFLRKLSNKFYVLNFNTRILGGDEYNDWWQLQLLRINEDNSFSILECTSKAEELPCMFYSKPSKYDIFYFDCQWTAEEMLRRVKEGYFEASDSLVIKNK